MDLLLDIAELRGANKRGHRARIESALRDAIRSGRLGGGTSLPASRELSRQLGVSRGVVVGVYEQLVAEGYLVARAGSGTRVAPSRADGPPPSVRPASRAPRLRYNLWSGLPDVSEFPRLAWLRAYGRAVRSIETSQLIGFAWRGNPRLRAALADYGARVRGAHTRPDNVVVCSGVTHGLRVVWAALARRGVVRVAVEDPGWKAHHETLRDAGLVPVPTPVDQRGLDVDELRRANVGAVVLTPAHQYPTGVVMAAARRRALVEWAQAADRLIVEDDYDAEYRYDREPIAALQGLAPQRVVYCGTISKTLSPGLRLGWLMVPDHLVGDVGLASRGSRAAPSALDQLALALLLECGDYERHVRRMRRIYRARRDAAIAALAEHLPGSQIGGAAAGLHLTVWLPDGVDGAAIARDARARGIAVHALHDHCAVDRPMPHALLVGYAALPEEALREAVRELAQLVEPSPHRRRP